MVKKKLTYVKTVYGKESLRDANITGYRKESDAKSFVSTCSKWGIDIDSCKIISIAEAIKDIDSGSVEFDIE